MKRVILIFLIGVLMNPTFHLYGIKITLAGDLTAARDRAHLAQKLMFQTKMLNVNNLDIIQNNLRLDDGTHVYALSQHGFDSATIYVPPKPVERIITARKDRFYYEPLTVPYLAVGKDNYGECGFFLCLGNLMRDGVAITKIDFSGQIYPPKGYLVGGIAPDTLLGGSEKGHEFFSAFGPDSVDSFLLPYSGTHPETGELVVTAWQLTDFEKDGFSWTTLPFMAEFWDPIWCGDAFDCDYYSKPHTAYLSKDFSRGADAPYITDDEGNITDDSGFWGYNSYSLVETVGITGGPVFATATSQQWYEGDITDISEDPPWWYKAGSHIYPTIGSVVDQDNPSKHVVAYLQYSFESYPLQWQLSYYLHEIRINKISNAVLTVEGLGHSFTIPGYGEFSFEARMYEINGQYVCLFALVLEEEDGVLDYGWQFTFEDAYSPRERQAFLGSIVEGGDLTLIDVTDGFMINGEMVNIIPGKATSWLFGIIKKEWIKG